MTMVYLGLGANSGDPVQQIIDARNRLAAIKGVNSLNSSSLYLTTPVGYAQQRDFLNCVCELQTDLVVADLYEQTRHIETDLGRVRDPANQNAARKIDIDLLLFGDLVLDSESLTVPHPRMHQRLFVLQPLAEISAQLEVGSLGTVAQLIERGFADGSFDDQQVYKLGS